MQKVMKNEVDTRYNEILRNLYVHWKLESKKKYEELTEQGLNTSGIGVKSLYNLIEKLVFESIENLDNMINQIYKEFNAVIPFKELKKYIQGFEKSIYGHIDSMQKDIKDIFNTSAQLSEASSELKVNNIKGNTKAKLDRIYLKNKNLQKYKKIDWLVIINILTTVIGVSVAIISLLIQLIDSSHISCVRTFFNIQ